MMYVIDNLLLLMKMMGDLNVKCFVQDVHVRNLRTISSNTNFLKRYMVHLKDMANSQGKLELVCWILRREKSGEPAEKNWRLKEEMNNFYLIYHREPNSDESER